MRIYVYIFMREIVFYYKMHLWIILKELQELFISFNYRQIRQYYYKNIYKNQNINIFMRKTFIVRQRSLGSLPSKQLSINQFMAQKSIGLQTYRSKMYQQSKILSQKQQDIIKLKTNLDHALKLAINQAVKCSKFKQQNMRSTQTKLHVEKKYLQINDELSQQKMEKIKMEKVVNQLYYELNKQRQDKKIIIQKNEHLVKQLNKIKKQLIKIPQYQQKIKEIQPLRLRIKNLQHSNRQQKLKVQQIQKQNKRLLVSIQELKQKIKQAKPYQEQLLQRIAFLERVNLQLERKMQDFHRRQHDYKKEIQHYKSALAKMTIDRNKFKSEYQETYSTLQEKIKNISELQHNIAGKIKIIQQQTQKLEQKTKESAQFEQKLQATIQFYKIMTQENQMIKKRILALQQNQQQMRRVLAAHLKVSQEVNIYITNRNSQILRLQQHKKIILQNLDQLQKKFAKLDRLFDEGSARGVNQIQQYFYSMLKQRNKFQLLAKDAKQQLAVKIIQFAEIRQQLQRKIVTYAAPIPKDSNLYESIISDKIQMIITLQTSNDQMIKIKKQQQQRIRELQAESQICKKQMYTLRLKASELFKSKKDLQQARNKTERYQQMIQQQRGNILDLNSQLDVLRAKNSQVSQKIYSLGMQNKNLTFKITQYQNVMKQLDIQYLNAKKIQNQKNAHILIDSIQKLQSGINSLGFYFSCCFCGEMLNNPITLAVCGHNYCVKCKDAYAEYCYECDTGQDIQKIYSSKYLKDTAGKYKFLVMVMKQAQQNIIKINL